MSYIKSLHLEISDSYHGHKEVEVMTEAEELEKIDQQEWHNATH